jgi:hypothetical protein
MWEKFSKFGFAALIVAFLVLPVGNAFAVGIGSNNQYYDVVFDEEGEAAVIAKLSFQNVSAEPLPNLELKIPGNPVRILNIVQEDSNIDCMGMSYPDVVSPQAVGGSTSSRYPYQCDPVYAAVKYDKTISGNELGLKIELAKKIEPQGSTTLFISYKASGYVTKTRGIYKFSFQTIKSNFDIDNARVAVNVSEELYLKEGKAKTNYESNQKAMDSVAPTASFGSAPALMSVSRSIEYKDEGFYKATSGLDPNENFVVEGKYYESSIWGNWIAVASTCVVLLILVILIVYILKKEKEG